MGDRMSHRIPSQAATYRLDPNPPGRVGEAARASRGTSGDFCTVTPAQVRRGAHDHAPNPERLRTRHQLPRQRVPGYGSKPPRAMRSRSSRVT